MNKSKIESLTAETKGQTIGADSICATCNHVALCVFCGPTNQPVIFCEEFEASDAPQIRLYGVGETINSKLIESNKAGLCVNCDNMSECSYARAEEGVFHCEEYV